MSLIFGPRSRAYAATFGLFLAATLARAESPRFIVDDEAFLDKVIAGAVQLKEAGRLVPLLTLQCQLNRQFFAVQSAPGAQTNLPPPALYQRLLKSTLAVGDFYQCDACTNWHFTAATAFVVASNGIICTSYHVVGNGEEDTPNKPDFLVAADCEGRVYPVREVLAADPDADTCLLKIDAAGLQPLPLRTNALTGERIYCLGHPEGNHFLFSQGMVARLMRSRDVMSILEPDGERTARARATLYLNVTAEFSPGSSGGPIVDEEGNVLAQVQSITSSVEDDGTNSIGGPFVSGPIRNCVASEEILRLMQPPPGYSQPAPLAQPPGFQPDARLTEPELLQMTRSLFARGSNALYGLDAPLVGGTLFKRFDVCAQAGLKRFPASTNRWEITLLQVRAWLMRDEFHLDQTLSEPEKLLQSALTTPATSPGQKAEADRLSLLLEAVHVNSNSALTKWEKELDRHRVNYPVDTGAASLDLEHLRLVSDIAPKRVESLARKLATSSNPAVAEEAQARLQSLHPTGHPKHNPSP
jgi:S1-C subfamily serine protease